jgi:hypothetical protein
MPAQMTTIGGLAAVRSRCAKARSTEVCVLATTAGKESALPRRLLPMLQMRDFPRTDDPDSHVPGE